MAGVKYLTLKVLLTLSASHSTIGSKECTPTLLVPYSTIGSPHKSHSLCTVGVCLYTIGDQQCTPTLFVPYSNIGGL